MIRYDRASGPVRSPFRFRDGAFAAVAITHSSTLGAHDAIAVRASRGVAVAMIVLTKAIELALFPAVMAFAASSDLFTMSITNRVSIILVAGFALLAALTGMGASDLLSHVGAGRTAVALAVVFVFFAFGWIGGGDAKLAAATALLVRFRPTGRLPALCIAVRRRADARDHLLSGHAAAAGIRRAALGRAAAP